MKNKEKSSEEFLADLTAKEKHTICSVFDELINSGRSKWYKYIGGPGDGGSGLHTIKNGRPKRKIMYLAPQGTSFLLDKKYYVPIYRFDEKVGAFIFSNKFGWHVWKKKSGKVIKSVKE